MIYRASKKDEGILQNLCRSVSEDDYVLTFLSSWLKERSIHVYEKDHRIVGMIRLTYSRDHQAHLGAVRVHPDFRRQGIATALATYCINNCQTQRIRLAVMDNPASQALAEKVGFHHVATFTFLSRNTSTTFPVQYEQGTASRALSLLKKSHLFSAGHSLLSTSFIFYEASPEAIEGLLVITNRDRLALLDFEIEEATQRTVQIAYCDQNPQLVRAILHEARKRNMQKIWAVIPRKKELVDLLRLNGFETVEWGENISVFELQK
jgi:N-acetylglutamate synthase-like GNAT family acetyltransferase